MPPTMKNSVPLVALASEGKCICMYDGCFWLLDSKVEDNRSDSGRAITSSKTDHPKAATRGRHRSNSGAPIIVPTLTISSRSSHF